MARNKGLFLAGAWHNGFAARNWAVFMAEEITGQAGND
jgi:hypothetical protein